jgi:hypothetical protein
MRDNKIILICGDRGSGKTDLTKKIIRTLSSNFQKVLLLDTFDSEHWRNMKSHDYPEGINERPTFIQKEQLPFWKNGTKRMIDSDVCELQKWVQKYVFNTVINYEDCKRYIEPKLQNSFKRTVLDSKQKNNDLIYSFHAVADVPRELIRVSDFLYLKHTQELDKDIFQRLSRKTSALRVLEERKASKDKYYTGLIELS